MDKGLLLIDLEEKTHLPVWNSHKLEPLPPGPQLAERVHIISI